MVFINADVRSSDELAVWFYKNRTKRHDWQLSRLAIGHGGLWAGPRYLWLHCPVATAQTPAPGYLGYTFVQFAVCSLCGYFVKVKWYFANWPWQNICEHFCRVMACWLQSIMAVPWPFANLTMSLNYNFWFSYLRQGGSVFADVGLPVNNITWKDFKGFWWNFPDSSATIQGTTD